MSEETRHPYQPVLDMDKINQDLLSVCGDRYHRVISSNFNSDCGHPAPHPRAEPYFDIRWGDGEHDHIETNDEEVICIVASNPYSNVIFRNLVVVQIKMTECDGSPVASLPNGKPSVNVVPSGMIAFGDLGPTATSKPTQIAREVVLESKGAKQGEYEFHIGYTYSVEFLQECKTDNFDLTLYAS